MFLLSDDLPNIMAKIKAVDGYDLQPLMDQYDLSYAEAAAYNRWLFLMWKGAETDFLLLGASERWEHTIRNAARWPDQKIYMQGAFAPESAIYNKEFAAYVRGVIETMP